MYSTARCNIEPLFFSQPGTILASSLMPSLMVSRRRRSTTWGLAPGALQVLCVIVVLAFFVVISADLVPFI